MSALQAQDDYTWNCGMPDGDSFTELLSQSGGCVNNTPWTQRATYRPYNQDMATLWVKVNFIFWQHETPIQEANEQSSYGNFDLNNAEHLEFIEDAIKNMNKRMGDMTFPSTDNCFDDNDLDLGQYLENGKIQYDVALYSIPSSYHWNIQNATNNTFYCPMYWNANYTNTAYDLLEQHNVRDGINVFFGQEGNAYYNIVVDNNFDPNTPDVLGFGALAPGDTDCSEWPGNQNNLTSRQRVAMVNEYLEYRFKQMADAGTYGNLGSDYDHYAMARVLAHELGHSLTLTHLNPNTPSCDLHNIMGNGQGNYLTPTQLGQAHRALHLTSVRQHVVCEYPSPTPRYITGTEMWAFDTKVYADIVVEAGAELTVCGNLFMPEDGTIIVKKGGKLNVDGGRISIHREEYEDCPEAKWGGIYVQGDPNRIHAEVDINNLTANDPGVLSVYNNALIERAKTAISTHNDTRRNRVPGTGNIPYYGGIVQADNAHFLNNAVSVSINKYPHDNFSYFNNCTFSSDDGSARVGVSISNAQQINFTDNVFEDITNGQGIILNNAQANILTGNRFTNMEHGVYAIGDQWLNQPIEIGISDPDPDDTNVFERNSVGIYAAGVPLIRIRSNEFFDNNFGVAISGETGYLIKGNFYEEHTAAESYENVGNDGFYSSECNTYRDAGSAIRLLGNNRSFSFNGNDFERVGGTATHPNKDVFVGLAQQQGQVIIGDLKQQGTAEEPVRNNFSGFLNIPDRSIDILTQQQNGTFRTNLFFYYHPADAELIPECDIDDSCDNNQNFQNIYSIHDGPDACATSGYIPPNDCEDKECLSQFYQALEAQKMLWDGNQSSELIDRISNNPAAALTYNRLLDESPFLSEQTLLDMLASTMPNSRKEAILAANMPLSATIWSLAENHLSTANYNALLAQEATTAHAERIAHLAALETLEQSKNTALQAVVYQLYKAGEITEVEDLLDNDESLFAKRLQINALQKQGLSTAAQTALSNYPNTNNEQDEYHTVIAASIQLALGQELTDNTIDKIELIADEEGLHSGKAQRIMFELKQVCYSPDLPSDQTQALQWIDNELTTATSPELHTARVYPNPTQEHCNIQLPKGVETAQLSILDAQGSLLERRSVTQGETLLLNTLPKGLLFIRIEIGDSQSTHKLIRL